MYKYRKILNLFILNVIKIILLVNISILRMLLALAFHEYYRHHSPRDLLVIHSQQKLLSMNAFVYTLLIPMHIYTEKRREEKKKKKSISFFQEQSLLHSSCQ